MQDGDLVFRCGHGVLSRAVTTVEEEGKYSHVGILIRHNRRWNVIHAVPGEKDHPGDFERVKEECVKDFFSFGRAYKGCMVHTGLKNNEILDGIRNEAIRFVRDSIRFDDKYDLNDSSKVYCTEFVWLLYKKAGIDLSEGRRRFVKAFNIHNECLLPEHLLNYCDNEVYFCF